MGTLIAIVITCAVFFLVGKMAYGKVKKKESKGDIYYPEKDKETPDDKDNQA